MTEERRQYLKNYVSPMPLTLRQQKIYDLYKKQLTYFEIGQELNITTGCVSAHMRMIKKKLGLTKDNTSPKQRNTRNNNNLKSGHQGVLWHKASSQWHVRIFYRGKNKYLGSFSRLEDAITTRKEAEIKKEKGIL